MPSPPESITPETCVLFVGFQAPGTPGRAIQRAAQAGGDYVLLDGQRVPVVTLDGLSAHADRDWLAALPSPRRIAINHGEPEAQRALAQRLSELSWAERPCTEPPR